MKKLFILATAAVALASCSDSDLVGNIASSQQTEQPQAVEFGTYLGTTATRAAYDKGVITNAEYTDENSLKNAKFGVFAYYTGAENYVTSTTPTALEPNFMYNQEISWGSTLNTPQWIYSPVKYWPNGIDADNKDNPSYTATQAAYGKLSFFAFAPFTATPTTPYTDGDGTKPTQITSNDYVKKNTATKGVNVVTTNAYTGNVWVKYLMPKAASTEAVDLLWGTNGQPTYDETDGVDPVLGVIGSGYNVNLTKQTVGEKVAFLFKHALAKVGGSTATVTKDKDAPSSKCGFKVVVDVDMNDGDNQATYFGTNFENSKTLVTIEKVEIMDGASAATAGITTSGTKSDFNTFGWFNIETGSWCDDAGTYGYPTAGGATYSITADKDEVTIDDDAVYEINKDIREATVSDPSGTWSTTSSGGATGVTTTPKPLFADEDVPALLVIPGGTNNTLYVRIKYWVRTADTNLKDGYSNVSQTITNSVNLGSSLDPNKYYTIIIHLGLTSVKFEAVVTDWAQSENASYDENGNVTDDGDENSEKMWLPSNVVTANTWSITGNPTYAAKGGDNTLTVTMNGGSALTYNATTPSTTEYTLEKVGTADWLTIDGTGKLNAEAYTTGTTKRTAVVNVSTIVNGNTITTPITIVQEGFALALTPSGSTVTVKDGDAQNVTTGYSVTVTGGDGKATHSESSETITVSGTPGQTYTVTVTHTASGATETVSVTIPTT